MQAGKSKRLAASGDIQNRQPLRLRIPVQNVRQQTRHVVYVYELDFVVEILVARAAACKAAFCPRCAFFRPASLCRWASRETLLKGSFPRWPRQRYADAECTHCIRATPKNAAALLRRTAFCESHRAGYAPPWATLRLPATEGWARRLKTLLGKTNCLMPASVVRFASVMASITRAVPATLICHIRSGSSTPSAPDRSQTQGAPPKPAVCRATVHREPVYRIHRPDPCAQTATGNPVWGGLTSTPITENSPAAGATWIPGFPQYQ